MTEIDCRRPGMPAGRALVRYGILFVMFFLIAAGLGYPTLSRYDPRTANLPDSERYVELTERGAAAMSPAVGMIRVLVPFLARPIYLAAQGALGSWHPALFALLVVNALFCAGTALILVGLGERLFGDPLLGLLGGLLYLANFCVANLYLAALVDGAEAFFFAALAAVLLAGPRFRCLLPLLFVLGPLAKETFFVFGGVFLGFWWLLLSIRERRPDVDLLRWSVLSGLAGYATVGGLLSYAHGTLLLWPWEWSQATGPKLPSALPPLSVIVRQFLYPFAWLLPLALPSLFRLPRPWIGGAFVAAGIMMAIGLAIGAGGADGSRHLFNITGAPIALAAAVSLTRLSQTVPSPQRR